MELSDLIPGRFYWVIIALDVDAEEQWENEAMPARFVGLLAMNTLLATGEQPLPPGFMAWREMCTQKPLFGVGRLLGRGNPQMTEAEWDDVFGVDLKSAWLCARAVLPAMLAAKKGAIVNIASVHADFTFPGYFPYAAAKSGLVGLTRSLALEVGPSQVRVNALSPGWTETALVAEYFARQPADTRAKVLDVHPMGRIARPAEIANCAAFLLSDEASFVTGANWRVDGGMGARFAG